MSPSQHTEQIFKQILGGCSAIVEGLGSLRNKISDAHGQGKNNVKPSPRHAEFAVNLAGTMAVFLFSTWEMKKEKT
ncbi:abortive infection family protein [Acinetobacter baumannii 348935]|nr:abortive infection family protein [Acinetobacter baumannii 348935]